jgi:putative oxidoreductase
MAFQAMHMQSAEHARDVPDPHLMARLTILIKLLGGFAVILGAFVAIVRVPIVAV